jgi:uncharacterized protein (DUF697 family)
LVVQFGSFSGKEVTKTSGRVAKAAIRKYVAKEVLAALQGVARKLGYKLLQRTLVRAAVPGVSIFVGAWWNKKTTKVIGQKAHKHFEDQRLLMATEQPNGSIVSEGIPGGLAV